MKDVRIHDFEKSKKYNPSQIKFLTTYSEAFVKSSNMQMQYELNSQNDIKMALNGVSQEPFGEFIENIDYNSVIVDFSVGEKANNLLIVLDKSVSLITVDCLLGGNGNIELSRDLTEIDVEILNYTISSLLRKTSDFVDSDSVTVQYIHTNKAQYRNPCSQGNVFIADVEVYLNGNSIGKIKVCVPFISVEKIIDVLISRRNSSDSTLTSESFVNKDVVQSLYDNHIEFDVIAELGSTMISVQQLLSINEGDVLMLDRKTDEDIDILVGGEKAYIGKPGKVGQNNAVIITDSIEGEVSENDEREYE